MSTTTNQPAATFPLETPEKWARVRKLAEAADLQKLNTLLKELELPAKLAPAFVAAVAEEAERWLRG